MKGVAVASILPFTANLKLGDQKDDSKQANLQYLRKAAEDSLHLDKKILPELVGVFALSPAVLPDIAIPLLQISDELAERQEWDMKNFVSKRLKNCRKMWTVFKKS